MRYYIPFIISLALLSACSGNDVRNSLGLGVHAPDEFMITTHPELAVPNDFDLPKPGDVPSDLASNKSAAAASEDLFHSKSGKSAPVSKGESALLSKTGANKVDPNIRGKIYAEREEADQRRLEREDSTLGSLDPWNTDEKDPVVDSTAEQKRIEEAKKEGKPITSDGVKEKERKPKAPLEGIFN